MLGLVINLVLPILLLAASSVVIWRIARRFITPTTPDLQHSPRSRSAQIIPGTALVIAAPIVVLMLIFIIVAMMLSSDSNSAPTYALATFFIGLPIIILIFLHLARSTGR